MLLMIILPMPVAEIPVISRPVSLAAVTPDFISQLKGSAKSGEQQVSNAYRNRQSDVIVENVSGVVTVMLPDDNEGSRHQRFIIRLASGQTVLVVHNIDLAARINSLRVGDRVSVKGEYEWNDRGGLIHWTHKDPRNVHPAGWIDHNGVRYE